MKFWKIFASTLFFMLSLPIHANDDRYIDAASSFVLGPLTVDRLKGHYGTRLRESNLFCTFPENAALRPKKGFDCRTWIVERVRLGAGLLMDSVVYGAKSDGTISSAAFSIETECGVGFRMFLNLQSIYFPHGVAKAVGYGFDDSRQLTKGVLSMENTHRGSNTDMHLELRVDGPVCELTYQYTKG